MVDSKKNEGWIKMKYDSTSLKTAFDMLPISIMILDKNTLITYVNKSALSLINKEEVEVLRRNFGDGINCIESHKNVGSYGYGPRCENCLVKKAISSALVNGEVTENLELRECLLKDRKKKDFWFKISVTPITVDEEANVLITIIDISELMTVKESLNRHLKLAEITDDIMLFVDLDGNIIDVNKAAVKSYGYSYEELLSMNIHHIRADRENIMEQMKIANETGVFFEAIHKRKDGSYFNVEVSSRVIIMNDKRILGSIVRDITEKKVMEEKLKEQESLFRKVFEQSPIGMAFCKSSGEIIKANPMYEKIFERSTDELKILGWKNITHPEDLNKDLENFTRFKRGLVRTYTTNKRYIKPDGSIVWGKLTLASLSIKNQTSPINIAMVEDITEYIKSEQDLHENKKFKEVLISNLPGIAYRCKYDREWTMEFISDGCLKLTGYAAESLLNNKELSYKDLISEEYREHLWIKWAEAIKARDDLKEEYSIITSSGEVKWVLEQGHGIYDKDGQVMALEGLIIDITDRKRKENEILYLNYHDVLTGLYNRRYFDEKVELLSKENSFPISIIVGDINGLKQINAALGHSYGDDLIIAISKIIIEHINEPGIVARTGGDDFSILLPGVVKAQANDLMKKIHSYCNEYTSKAKNIMYHTSTSFGCATKTNERESLESIIKNAEDNMYRNKLLQKKSMHSSVVSSIITALLERSQETEEHALRLFELCKDMGNALNLDSKQQNDLELLSILHDIGKIGIRDSILNKPGKLTDEEWDEMKKHPEIGYRIAISTPELEPIADYILTHHERYDGKGYPQGIKGKDIPLISRILAIVDAYDAMTEDRPYRKAISKEAALAEIRQNAGTQFDPEFANVFIDILTKS